MPYTAADHIDDFRRMHRECDQSTAQRLLNEIDEEILFWIPLRRSFVSQPLVAGQREYDINETILKIWKVQVYTSANTFRAMAEVDCDRLDIDEPNWRSNSPSASPWRWYDFADQDSGQIGIDPAPLYSTRLVQTATAATPIVVTTSAASHGFTNGVQVQISDVTGLVGANGTFYIKTVGYAANQFALYSDPTLLTGVTGTVGPSSGGIIAGPNSPKLVLECSQRTALTYSPATAMPATPAIKRLYRVGMSYLWAYERRQADWRDRKREFEDLLAEQFNMKFKRQGHKSLEIMGFRQRMGWRRDAKEQSRW